MAPSLKTICGVLLLLAGCVRPAAAHTPSETILTFFVSGTNVTGQWDVAQRDLDEAVKLYSPRGPALAPSERELWLDALVLDVVARLEVMADGQRLTFRVTDLEPVVLNTLDYRRVRFAAASDVLPKSAIEINAHVLFRLDTNLHGLLRVEHAGRTEAAAFNAEHPSRAFTLSEPVPRVEQAWTFIREGMGHIWHGPDHILFLIALLLPAVLKREGGTWAGTDSLRSAFMRVFKIVTAFTVAHSITLSLAVLGIVQVSPRIVEPLIAASVIAAAANNLRPWFGERGWMVAFGFGLVHGFGLAGGLLEFGLRRETLAMALVGYNFGVELGQLAIVAIFLPVAYALARSWFYRTVAFKFGSAAVALLAGMWMAERLFEFKLLPF